MRAAAVQMTATPDRDHNRSTVERLVGQAAGEGAELVVLPELWSAMGSSAVLRDAAEPLDGPSIGLASRLASAHGLWLLAGSVVEAGTDGRLYNTSCLLDPTGERVTSYRKIHLFDVDVPGVTLRESDSFSPGDQVVVTDRPPMSLGFSTCYDLRFPELYRSLALGGAQVIVVPSAFTATTGPDHWEPLLRARAIEDQVWIVAADQTGASTDRLAWHGHSMIIDPWGTVVAQVADGEGVIVADLTVEAVAQARRRIPSLANRRPDTYAGP